MRLQAGTPEAVGMSATRIRHVANLAKGWVEQGITPALVVLVARRGVIVLHEAFGCLTPEGHSSSLPRDTIFPIASITKPITATAIMILVEEGRLGLNRPVVEYIPELAGEGKQAILVHHLLTHTSGLRDEDIWLHAEKKYIAGIEVPTPATTQHPKINQWLAYGYDTPLWKQPGIEMSYCDYNYELLGEIVRRVSGQALHDFVTEHIFAPLGMVHSWYRVPETVTQQIVKRPPTALYAGPQSSGWETIPTMAQALFVGLNSREFQELPTGCNGVFATAQDIAIFGQLFLNRGHYGDARILSPTTIAAMTRNQIPGVTAKFHGQFFPEASWGLGWNIPSQKKAVYDGALYSAQAFCHGGAGGVQLWIDPVYELVGIYFSVVLRATDDGLHSVWPVDLFMNAVTAAVSDE